MTDTTDGELARIARQINTHQENVRDLVRLDPAEWERIQAELEQLNQIVNILPSALTTRAFATVAGKLLRADQYDAVRRLLQLLDDERMTAVRALMSD